MSLSELRQEKKFLLGSLADLEREKDAGEIEGDDYEALKDDYTARAAAVLRAIQAAEAGTGAGVGGTGGTGGRGRRGRAGREAARPSGGRASGWQRGVAIAIVVGMVVVTMAGVFLFATGRDGGQPITGGVPTGVVGRLAQAHELEANGEILEALKLYDSVLREDPLNVEALAYRGWLLRLAGLTEEAKQLLDLAVSAQPLYPDARFFRGVLLLRDLADPAAAVIDLEAFLSNDPPGELAMAVGDLLAEAKTAAAAAGDQAPAPTVGPG